MAAGDKIMTDAQGWLQRACTDLCRIVDRYAIVKVTSPDLYLDDNAINDFFYYCITKAAKSLIGINLLLKAGLGEDAQIVLRSVYESYLAISFLAANPKRVDDLVEKKVGVYAERYQHPLNSKGKKNRRKIVDPQSGATIPFDVSIAEMVIKSKHGEDEAIHWPLYAFLSEHCHPHFVGSGNYRHANQVNYSYRSRFQLIQARVYAVYVYVLLIAEIKAFGHLRNADLRKTSSLLKSGDRILSHAIDTMIFVRSMKDMPTAMHKRLAKHAPAAGI